MELADHEAADVVILLLIQYPQYGVCSEGWHLMPKSSFSTKVIGRNISELDSTFCPVVYRSKDRAQLGVEVFIRRTGYFYQPVLNLDADGVVTSIDNDPNTKKLKGFRGEVLRKAPYAAKIMQVFSSTIEPPMYSVASKRADYKRDRYILDMFGLDMSSTSHFSWWMWIVFIIVSAVYFCVLSLQWFGYYTVFPFIFALVIMVLVQKPQPLKFIPNPVLKVLLWVLCLSGLYVGFIFCMTNAKSLWLIVIPVLAVFGLIAVYKRIGSLVKRRCPH